MTKYTHFILTFFIVFSISVHAQIEKTGVLYKTIMSRDSLLFLVGFNTCNVTQMENLLSDQLEFYHDKDGFSDKKKFMVDFKNGLCRPSKTYKARRALVEKSTEIYPMYKEGEVYAVIQNGTHQFYEKEAGQAEKLTGAAKFTHVWVQENGEWKLKRALSFDHQAKNISDENVFENDQAIENWLKENKIPTLGLGIIEGAELKQINSFWRNKKRYFCSL
ncbi:hypothetical protein M2347_002550 [Chryseobacterium sp. H1D6B]|uniref:nuclear transport factor 2 family protein n=1 Tax=Chryseobacterium sp. H1D6B TaxID=2940588 RepID=UPI001840FF65|nr:hypothetical protein [Chryseobacterium sp. H1D6B]